MAGKIYSRHELENIYRRLFDMNMEAAEDDYQEYFSDNFDPDTVLSEDMSIEAVGQALSNLFGELVDDLGDEGALREWIEECGGDGHLYDDLATGVYADLASRGDDIEE